MKSFRCALAFIGVLGLNDLAPPPPSHFPRTILWVVSLNDGRRPRSQRSDVPLRRARARLDRSIDRRRLPPVERERERTTWKDPRDLSRWGKGRDRQTFLFLTWQIFFSSCGTLCVCVCARKLTLCLARKNSPLSLSLSLTHALFLSRARVTTERTKEELRLVVLVHSLRVFLPHDSLLTEKSGRGV